MRIFMTGATGWVGSAVVPELLRAGHEVVGLARSDSGAATLAASGAVALLGELNDLDSLRRGAADSDGVIHLAFRHDIAFSPEGMVAAAEADRQAVDAMAEALAGSGRPLVIASGTPAVPGRGATERDESPVVGPTAQRGETARTVVAMAGRGIRSAVVRLPRSVHGDGDMHGFIPRLIQIARERGVSGYVGDGSSRWPAVHVLDAAHLFRIALEHAPAGSVLHSVGDEGVATREIADAIGRHLDVPTGSAPAQDFGFLGLVLANDQPASSLLTRQQLGWEPFQPGLIEDLDRGHYFAAVART